MDNYENFVYHRRNADPTTVRLGKIVRKFDGSHRQINAVEFLHYAPADIIRMLDKGATMAEILKGLKAETTENTASLFLGNLLET
jgi:hypothetical protein